MTKHISCDCKFKFNSTICNSNKKWNNKTCKCACKNYHKYKKDFLLTAIWLPNSYLLASLKEAALLTRC